MKTLDKNIVNIDIRDFSNDRMYLDLWKRLICYTYKYSNIKIDGCWSGYRFFHSWCLQNNPENFKIFRIDLSDNYTISPNTCKFISTNN